ncbi:hypothetical protein KUCAC02_002946, partial [Chaenocephalus aceratus]
MTRVSNYLNWTTNPPGYVEKASRYVKSSMGQGRDDEVPEGPAGADSDSGDSLFITQKPVPEALRTGVRTRYSQWAKPLSPRDLHESEESEENKESSDSNDGESQSGKVQRSKKNVLPKFHFPFLKEKKPELLPVHNKRLHSYLVGGFFECVRLLRQGCQTKKDVESSLPTVDMDGEHISQLSEDDGEKLDEADIKVVEKEEKRTSSFRVADAEDNDAQTPVELNDNGVRKKRKLSAAQDSVEINPEQGFEEPNTGVKRKKKETGNETESRPVCLQLQHSAHIHHPDMSSFNSIVSLEEARRVAIFGGTHGNEMSGVTLVNLWVKNGAEIQRKGGRNQTVHHQPEGCGEVRQICGHGPEPSLHAGKPQLSAVCWRPLVSAVAHCGCVPKQSPFNPDNTGYLLKVGCKEQIAPQGDNQPYEVQRAQEINGIFGPKGSPDAYDVIFDLHNTTSNMGCTLILESSKDHFNLQMMNYIK